MHYMNDTAILGNLQMTLTHSCLAGNTYDNSIPNSDAENVHTQMHSNVQPLNITCPNLAR